MDKQQRIKVAVYTVCVALSRIPTKKMLKAGIYSILKGLDSRISDSALEADKRSVIDTLEDLQFVVCGKHYMTLTGAGATCASNLR